MASASGTVFVWSKTSVYPPALSHGKGGGSGGYTPAALPEIAQPGQAVKGKPPQAAGAALALNNTDQEATASGSGILKSLTSSQKSRLQNFLNRAGGHKNEQ